MTPCSLPSKPIQPFVHSCFHLQNRAFGSVIPWENVSDGDSAAPVGPSGKGALGEGGGPFRLGRVSSTCVPRQGESASAALICNAWKKSLCWFRRQTLQVSVRPAVKYPESTITETKSEQRQRKVLLFCTSFLSCISSWDGS